MQMSCTSSNDKVELPSDNKTEVVKSVQDNVDTNATLVQVELPSGNKTEVITSVSTTTTTVKPLRIGIDFGGVLSKHDTGIVDTHVEDTSSSGQHVSTAINMDGGIDSLLALKDAGHELYIISFCGAKRAAETRSALLAVSAGLGRTLFDGIYFTKKKDFKVNVCEYLGCDVLIDDTYEIIIQCKPTTLGLWFKGDPSFESSDKLPTKCDHQLSVSSWKTCVDFLTAYALQRTHRNPQNLNINLTRQIYTQSSNPITINKRQYKFDDSAFQSAEKTTVSYTNGWGGIPANGTITLVRPVSKVTELQ
jgi:hypothetical protein